MARNYDGSRRAEAARRTREQILAAAFRLHGEGILDIDVLAREANVSVPTVRKHFPTREILFEGCTAYGLHLVSMPDIESIGKVSDPIERVEFAVRQVYSLHESLFGQVWTAFQHELESTAFATTLSQIEDQVARVTDELLAAWPASGEGRLRGLIAGMFSPLTYRGLRLHGGLSPSEAVRQAASMIEAALTAGASREEAVHT